MSGIDGRRRRLVTVLLSCCGALLVVWLAGCGVPAGRVERLDPDRVPFDLLAPPEYSATTEVAPTDADVVYLVRGQRLAPVVRDGLARDPSTLIDALVKGPTSEETAAGLRSAITDAAIIDHVEQGSGDVTISFADAFSELAPSDQLVAAAQLTYTLTELSGVNRVVLLRGDEPLAVPRPDGTVSEGPVTRADFATLAP